MRTGAIFIISCMLLSATTWAQPLGDKMQAGGQDSPLNPLEEIDEAEMVQASSNPAEDQAEMEIQEDTIELPDGSVARVGTTDVPLDWYEHEFRSSFFRYGQATNVHQEVMDALLNRMALYEAAKQAGITDEPEIMDQIEERIAQSRAFMEYQLAMMEIRAVVDEYLSRQGLNMDAIVISEDDVRKHFDEKIAGSPRAPASFEEVPTHIVDRLKTGLQNQRHEEAVQTHANGLKSDMDVVIDAEAMEAVEFPQMMNAPPGASRGPGGPGRGGPPPFMSSGGPGGPPPVSAPPPFLKTQKVKVGAPPSQPPAAIKESAPPDEAMAEER